MKVIEKKATDGRIELECTADTSEVNYVLDLAGQYFAMKMGIRPTEGRTAAQAVERAMNIKDLDAVVANDAIEMLTPFALDKRNIIPAFPPESIGTMQLKRGKEYAFRLYVTPKPEYELKSYDAPVLSVPKFKAELGDAVDRQLEQMAEQNCIYEDCDDEGPVAENSTFKLGLKVVIDGVEDKRLATEGRTYMMGMGFMPEDFDKNLMGMKAGETRTFTCELPDWDDATNQPKNSACECTATIVSMQKKVIPAITDEWVKANIPMCLGVDNLRETIEIQMSQIQRSQYDESVKQYLLESISNRFQGKIADEVYENYSKSMVQNIREGLAQQNVSWEQFVQENGGEQQMQMMLMMQTRASLVNGYILDAFFRHENLTVEDRDIAEACATFDPRNPDAVRKEFLATGRGFALREMSERCRAQRWLMDNAKITYIDPEAPISFPDAPAAE